jgi:hypothetical protein
VSGADELLSDVRSALRVLWVAGLEQPEPSLPSELADLSLVARSLKLEGLADALTALRHTLAPQRTAEERFVAWRRVWVRARLLADGVAREHLARHLSAQADGAEPAAPVRPRGRSATLWPVGVEIHDDKLHVHALDADGHWVTLDDRPVHLDPDDPAHQPTTSRLFQGEVRLLDVLTGELELVDHPGVATAARWVARPAFHTHPRVRPARQPGPPVPDLPIGARLALGRADGRFERSPDGWHGRCAGSTTSVPPLLAFDLDKQSTFFGLSTIGTPDACWVARGDRRVLLSVDDPPRFPSVDPTATTASLASLVADRHDTGAAALRALAWPVHGGDRAAIARALAPAATSDDLARRHAAEAAGLAIGLPPHDDAPGAHALLGAPDASVRGAEELLVALWLTERHAPMGATLAGLLLGARTDALDDDDALEIALRAWLRHRHAPDDDDGPVAFLAAHAERLGPGHVPPDARGLSWLHHVYTLVSEGRAGLPPWPVGRLVAARAALAAVRDDDDLLGPRALVGWRWAARADVLPWLLGP